jgi:branched-chain amino acid transport system substrate-binding protein
MTRFPFSRRQLLGTLAAAPAAVLARLARAQDGVIRIGLMAPLTGVVASGGREMVDDFNWYWSQHGEVAGRKVEVVVEDDGSNPDTALQKARRLVEQSKVQMLFGNLLANTGLAVANYVKGTGTPYFISIIAADDLTQRARIKNVVRVAGYSASQCTRPLADWALKQGYKRIATVSQDYVFGHEQCGGLAQTFTEGAAPSPGSSGIRSTRLISRPTWGSSPGRGRTRSSRCRPARTRRGSSSNMPPSASRAASR